MRLLESCILGSKARNKEEPCVCRALQHCLDILSGNPRILVQPLPLREDDVP